MLFLQVCDESDIQKASQMMCRVYEESPLNESWSLERAQERVSLYFSGADSRGYAMIIDTQIIGYIFGRITIGAKCNGFYVDEIFVHPNYQRKGCASMALRALYDELKNEDVRKFELRACNEDVEFFEKNGFARTSCVSLEKVFEN